MLYLLYERWLWRHFQKTAGEAKTTGHKDEAQAGRVAAGAEIVQLGGIGEKNVGESAGGSLASSSGSVNQPPCKGVQGTDGTSPGTAAAAQETAAAPAADWSAAAPEVAAETAAMQSSATTLRADLHTSRPKFVYRRPRQRLVRKQVAIKVGTQ